jgi:hypothetical protein
MSRITTRQWAQLAVRLTAFGTIAALTLGIAAAQGARQIKHRLKPLVAFQTPNVPPAKQYPAGGGWQAVATPAPFGAGTALLLTDGRVFVQDSCSRSWWTLTPDAHGSYVNGAWTQKASTQAGYGPLYFSSAVLPDGRVIVNGGEYNNSGSGCPQDGAWTTLGAIYNPNNNKWTAVSPPSGWTSIGDAQNVVLPDLTFLLADCCTKNIAKLDPHTLTWTAVSTTGKVDVNDEEGWTLLPDGSILTVDASTGGSNSHAERYYSSAWHDAGTLAKLNALPSEEVGPAVLMPNGKVFATGGTAHTAIYTPPGTLTGTGSWTQGPDFPIVSGKQYDIADGPAALLPNGNVLVMASPGVFNTPSHFYEFNGSNLTQVSEPPNAPSDSSFYGRMLVLPTGQVLLTDGSSDVEIYTPTGSPMGAWRPTIVSFPSSVTTGQSYKLSGKRLNGLSQASVYGDDSSAASNYPLVRITHNARVIYARTFNHSSMGVAVAGKTSTNVDIPASTPTGAAMLEVVVNGIASAKFPITVVAGPTTVAARASAAE